MNRNTIAAQIQIAPLFTSTDPESGMQRTLKDNGFRVRVYGPRTTGVACVSIVAGVRFP
jgi:hypothetical protein